MGLGADAELIWGIPVLAYDEDTGEPTKFWNEEDEDWNTFEGELEVRQFGHYEDPDNHRGILTSTRVEPVSAGCWTPTPVPSDLASEINNDKLYSKSNDQARASGLDVNFYGQANWWLVASYG